MSTTTIPGTTLATSGTTTSTGTLGTIDTIACGPCLDRLPVGRSARARASRSCGARHEVNSGEARTLENKVSYKLPTCLGPMKVKSSQVSKAERSSQVKSSHYSRAAESVHHKLAGC